MNDPEFDFCEALQRRLGQDKVVPVPMLLKLRAFALQQRLITEQMTADEQAAIVRRFWASFSAWLDDNPDEKAKLKNANDNASLRDH